MIAMSKSETKLIRWITQRISGPARGVSIGIGDDMAALRFARPDVLLTADMLMDGVDFDASRHSPERIGRKAVAASLSDCAAMAVRPRFALVSVALPNAWTMTQGQRLFRGLDDMALQHGCRIVGGDTNGWSKPLVIDVLIAAEPWKGIAPVRRDGMRPGDNVYVTGVLGGSLRGHHLDFAPRVREARRLAAHLGAQLHAMMDLSDGLGMDGRRMAAASRCGIELDEAALESVASPDAQRASASDGRSLLDHVLNDGEDFELLCAVDAHAAPPLRLGCRWTRIGVATRRSGVWLRGAAGRLRRLPRGGWEHWTAGK